MITDRHIDYVANKPIWDTNRDAFKGQKAIKDKGELYLPRLGYHLNAGKDGDKAYANYLKGAVWFDATYRTITAMTGLVFRKNPYVDTKKLDVSSYLNDFTIDNKTLNAAAEECVQETTLQGRVGLLVSYPEVDTSNMSQQEVKDRNIHAYSAIYKTETIINWKLGKIDGRLVPILVVLAEEVSSSTSLDSTFSHQYRVLEIDEYGFYKQTVHLTNTPLEDNKEGLEDSYTITESYPLMNGERLTYIPFYPITPNGISWDISRSPMEGIVSLNIGHYRNSALYESSLVITASPTTVLRGYQKGDDNEQLLLGGNNVIVLPTDGGADFLEYQGQGLGSIEKAMNDKKKDMAVLGLRILSSEQNVNEGADTATIHQTGEQSVLANVANSVSDAFTQAFKTMILWDDPAADVSDVVLELNTDFTPNALTANDLNSLTVMYKSGIISDEEMFDILKRGEVLSAETTYAKHKEQLQSSMFYSLFAGEQDFTAPVDASRLTKPDAPGEPNAPKQLSTDSGDADS